MISRVVVVLPTRYAGVGFEDLVKGLIQSGIMPVIVDDGSPDPIPEIDGAVVLHHERNLGKGRALKTAFGWIREHRPEAAAIVTADADGQHRLEDILKIAEESLNHPDKLTIGSREFSNGKVPFRSKLGNLWTRAEFKALTGVSVRDTQSGLRGFSSSILPELLEIRGDRYEYEIAALVHCAKRMPINAVTIATIYLDGNQTSFYRPLADSFRTQFALFKAALTST